MLLHRLFSMGKPDSLTFPKRSRGLRRGELGKKKTNKGKILAGEIILEAREEPADQTEAWI